MALPILLFDVIAGIVVTDVSVVIDVIRAIVVIVVIGDCYCWY